jgi:gliding motility-associatede transport system auxiliary component
MLKRIAAILGWLGTAAVAVAVFIRLFKPDWAKYGVYAAWVGLVLVLLYLLSQWKETAASMSRRQTRLSAIAFTSVVVVLGLLVAVNYLSSRRNKRWDLTANQAYSLSPQTRQILDKLDAPLKIRVFDKPTEFDRFRDRLSEYEYVSKKVSVEYIDADKDPIKANQNQVQQYGTVVFDYKGKTERVTSSEEGQLTNGLIKLITGKERKVYFLQGHGEKDTANSERTGYSAIAAALGSENFKVDNLVLLQQQTVPADATIVAAAGPATDLFPPEIEALTKYMKSGGKVLLLLDPPQKADAQPLTNLIAFAKEFGIDVGTNVVVDVSEVGRMMGTDASVPVAAKYPSHPITEKFRLVTAYPLARSVTAISGGANGHAAQNIIETSANSWGETDLADLFSSGKVENDKTKDLQGPVMLGAAMSETVGGPAPASTPGKDAKDQPPRPDMRLVVIGDSDFASNSALGIQGNRDLFLNVMNWLARQENLISIRPKDPDDRRITLTDYQQKGVMLFALIGLPVAIFGLGVYGWARRRR